MFANNLTDKLTGLLKYEIISITVISGKSTVGTPLGTNILKYLKPCLTNPIIVTAMKIKSGNQITFLINKKNENKAQQWLKDNKFEKTVRTK